MTASTDANISRSGNTVQNLMEVYMYIADGRISLEFKGKDD